MNFLGIDTTGSNELIVAYINNKKYVTEYKGTRHSEELLTHVEKVIGKAHVSLKDIDVFGNVSGPGSFTGIRIGLATIKAFAFALNKPVVNVSRFEILSSAYSGYAIIKCTKTSVYWAKIGKTIEYGVADLDDLEKIVPTKSQVVCLGTEQIDLPTSYKNIVTVEGYKDLVLPYMLKMQSESKLCDSNEIQPLYIQVSQAERLAKVDKW